MNYVDGDPAHSSEDTKARKPLAAARSWSRRWKQSGLLHVPSSICGRNYQLEGLTVSLRLVSKLPSARPRDGSRVWQGSVQRVDVIGMRAYDVRLISRPIPGRYASRCRMRICGESAASRLADAADWWVNVRTTDGGCHGG